MSGVLVVALACLAPAQPTTIMADRATHALATHTNLFRANSNLLAEAISYGALTDNTLWVSPDGDNARAVRGRPDRPFATIAAAQAVAQPGDIIWVRPGWYQETGLGRDKITYALQGAWLGTYDAPIFAVTNAHLVLWGGVLTNYSGTNSILVRMEDAGVQLRELTIAGQLVATGSNTIHLRECQVVVSNWLLTPQGNSALWIWGGRAVAPTVATANRSVIGYHWVQP